MNIESQLTAGDKVVFAEEKLPYSVMSANDRFAVCTRRLHIRHDADLLWYAVQNGSYRKFMDAYNYSKEEPVYTIVDFKNEIRGTENLVFCMGFGTKELCDEALRRLSNGDSEVSRRCRIGLVIEKVIN